jgi:hypothetical protein
MNTATGEVITHGQAIGPFIGGSILLGDFEMNTLAEKKSSGEELANAGLKRASVRFKEAKESEVIVGYKEIIDAYFDKAAALHKIGFGATQNCSICGVASALMARDMADGTPMKRTESSFIPASAK